MEKWKGLGQLQWVTPVGNSNVVAVSSYSQNTVHDCVRKGRAIHWT